MFNNLTTFLRDLEDQKELLRISAEVNPRFELGEIVRQLWEQGEQQAPALLFENVSGSSIPVVANLLGTEKRLCHALKVDSLDELGARALHLFQPNLPVSLVGSLKMMPQLGKLTHLSPKAVSRAHCQHVVKMGRELNLLELPVPHFYPEENGPVINFGQLYVQTPNGDRQHVGSYPAVILDEHRIALLWEPTQPLQEIYKQYQQAGQPLPFALVIGGEPVSQVMAHFPILFGLDPFSWGGFLRKKPLEVVQCRSNQLKVAADADLVLEGLLPIDPPVVDLTGIGLPFVETGFVGLNPIAEITAITFSDRPVYHTTVWGTACPEEFWLRKVAERTLLPLLRLLQPELVDLNLIREGHGRFILFFSFKKTYPYQARNLMNFLWSLPPFQYCKFVVAVDAEVDVQQESTVWHQLSLQTHPGRDHVLHDGPPDKLGDLLPHAVIISGNRMGLDATRKYPEEQGNQSSRVPFKPEAETATQVKTRWSELGLG